MTNENYQTILSSFDYVLIDFFLPWCGPCQKLAPEFQKAASRLKQLNKPIALAQVNAHENQFLVQKFTILEYPTLRFFAAGVELPYKGGDTEDEIYKWMRLRAVSSTRLINSIENLEELPEFHDMIIVYLGLPGETYEIYEKVTKTYDNLNFAHYFETDENSENRVVVIKKEHKFVYNPEKFNFHDLRSFINRYQTGVILPLDKYNAYKIFDDGKPGLVILLDSSSKSDQALEDLRNALNNAPELKEHFIAFQGDYNDEYPRTFMQLFNIQSEDLPQIRIVKPQKNSKNVDKYEPMHTGSISENSITVFCSLYLTGALKKSMKSQPVPRDNNENVKVLVGKTFDSVVYDESKDVFVNFYANWCHHCQQFEPIYRSLADQLSNNPRILLTKVDASQNEFDNIQINSYPTLKFFPSKSKQNPIDFQGNRDFQVVLEFIKKHTSFPWPSYNQNSNEPVELNLANFQEIVYNSGKNVLVNFYVTPCGYCRQLEPVIKDIIKEVKELGMEMIVGRIDWIQNNIPGLKVRAFPSVFLFLNDRKDNPIEYQGDRSFEDFMRFIKQNSGFEEENKKVEELIEDEAKIEDIIKTNFNGKVYDESNDFVLFLYKRKKNDKLQIVLNQLFDSFNTQKEKNMKFGEMDLEKSELPEEIEYQVDYNKIPSFLIFVRQYKRSPVQFMGNPEDLEEITKFLIKESSFAIESKYSENSKVKCDDKKCKEEL